MKTIQITIHNPEGKSTHSIITPLSHIYRKQYPFYLRSVFFSLSLSSLLLFNTLFCNESWNLSAYSIFSCIFYVLFDCHHNRDYAIPWILLSPVLQPLFTFVLFRLHTSFLSINESLTVHSTCAIIKLSIDGSFFHSFFCCVCVFFFLQLCTSLFLFVPFFSAVCVSLFNFFLFFLCYCSRSNCCVACRYRFAG